MNQWFYLLTLYRTHVNYYFGERIVYLPKSIYPSDVCVYLPFEDFVKTVMVKETRRDIKQKYESSNTNATF
jgi:hypothetical protein